ncbi:hypothetical protein BZM27_29765 [Paraburkholderia steynii]|uniref:Uncharacterized protein n=1 Tax=Paraburkholderia steynii TaxID=1245441 RepID=A0A4R0XAD8_9BURK|nr:hypothetical protein BZM27_29765 [Paraburkholderia steynii]
MTRPLEDYALLGDGRTAALVSRDGSIDWLCWPRFDGDACFAALLGGPENGCWTLSPADTVISHSRRYRDDTLIVETDFEVSGGVARVIDFMPVGGEPSSLVRIVVGLSGVVKMHSQLRLRFDYGALVPLAVSTGDTVHARVGQHQVVLRAEVHLMQKADCVQVAFEVVSGSRVRFVMTHGEADAPLPETPDAERALVDTQHYWQDWIARFDNRRTAWPAMARRSLLTLHALTFHSSGAIIAAPTTSLPEARAGQLNWDYRYCWLRDTSFAVVALLNAGFHDEARAWRDWLLRAIAGSAEHIRVMYRVDGSRHLPEWTADWLDGYRYARPVRIGNAAAAQRQIDVLGEVLDSLDIARRAGLPVETK